MRITFKGNGIVWDKDKEKTLCKFEGGHYDNSVWLEGEFTTDDPGIIEKLKNYPTVPADAMKYYREEKEGKSKAAEPKKKATPKKKAEVLRK